MSGSKKKTGKKGRGGSASDAGGMDPLLRKILEDLGEDQLLEKEGAGRKARGRTKKREAGGTAPMGIRSKGDPQLTAAMEAALAHSGRVEGRATHGFHTYPAGLHPLAARDVIAACEGPVHDPFCGGGTVLVEALLAGRPATGTDLSPVALLVAQARTAGPDQATPIRSAARRIADMAKLRVDVEVPEEIEDWYEPHVAQELGRLRDGIAEVEEQVTRELLAAVFSSILVKVSYRESDTRNRRSPHHRPPGTTAVLFHKKARELGRMLEQMPAEGSARMKLADAKESGPPEGTGLVLTSPPYPGVYDYLPMQQLRHAWLELDASKGLAQELGSRRSFRALGRQKALERWRSDHVAWIRMQAAGLPSGGRICIVVGDGLVGDRPVDTLSPTADAIHEAGLEIIARASADRPDHARGAIRTEHLVMAEKG